MFSRLSQLARHCAGAAPPPPTFTSARTLVRPSTLSMTSAARQQAALERSKRTINTAGCIIIGDEVLGGKTVDTNSAWFAKYCFGLGITLKRVEVIADDEVEIIEATQRMSAAYDFVVTSGGIGPTHDDITYASIAKGFGLPLVLHETALGRMKKLSRPPKPGQPPFSWDVDSPTRTARMRMVQLPYDSALPDETQVVFVSDDLWVPISVVGGNVHILPGIPRLFERMLEGLRPSIMSRLSDPEGKGVHRILFSTPLPESDVAEYLTQLSAKVASKDIKVGSYPRWGKSRNTVTLVGRDQEFMESLVPEVEVGVKGRRVMVEGEDDDDVGSDKHT